MTTNDEPRLPAAVVRLLDGTALKTKIGQTFLLMAADADGWPRLALLSAGEVVAVSETRLRLALYPNSGTTQALTQSGKALLTVITDEAAVRIRVEAERDPTPEGSSLAFFTGRVVAIDPDRVGYARITHGIEFELPDSPQVLERWQRQVSLLLTGG